MKRQLIPLFAFALLLIPALGFGQKNTQPKDSLPFDNRKYRNEIGVDVQGIFAGEIGGSFMYKKRTGDKKLIAVSYSDNLRFGGDLGGNFRKNTLDSNVYYSVTDNNDVLILRQNDYNQQYARLSIGKERVYYYGRFNVYYGMDILSALNYSASEDNYFSGYNYSAYLPVRTLSLILGASPFAGIKYRINNRLSISAEANYILSYALDRIKVGDKDSNQATDQDPYVYYQHRISHGLDPVRFVTLNYHFKQFR